MTKVYAIIVSATGQEVVVVYLSAARLCNALCYVCSNVAQVETIHIYYDDCDDDGDDDDGDDVIR